MKAAKRKKLGPRPLRAKWVNRPLITHPFNWRRRERFGAGFPSAGGWQQRIRPSSLSSDPHRIEGPFAALPNLILTHTRLLGICGCGDRQIVEVMLGERVRTGRAPETARRLQPKSPLTAGSECTPVLSYELCPDTDVQRRHHKGGLTPQSGLWSMILRG